jgi:hypothetical protein
MRETKVDLRAKKADSRDLMKASGLICIWIGGLILAGALLWFLTQNPRNAALLKAVNTVLASRNDGRRLEAPAPFRSIESGKARLGTWFTMAGNRDRALVFSIMNEGIMLPCLAIVSAQGQVTDIIPLNPRGSILLENIPSGLLQMYLSNIQGIK